MTGAGVTYAVLGPLEARRDGELVPLGGPKQRTVLAALLLDPGRVVSGERLAELVWGEVPDHAASTLPVYMSNLRRALRDDARGDPLVTRKPGYLIEVEPELLDLTQVRDLRGQAAAHRESGEPAVAAHLLRLALGLWRGPALADLRESAQVGALVLPLDRQRTALRRELMELELELGRHLTLLPELHAAVADDPYDENLVSLLAIALYRSGRQGEALDEIRAAGARLAEDLGIDPGPELRAVEAAVLRQDPVLELLGSPDPGVTQQRDDRGVRGATLTLPNGVPVELQSRTWVIGRHPACEVVLSDPESSRRHAEVRPVRDGYLLVDLHSTNGTRVNGAEVREHRLSPGDVVVIGATRLTYDCATDAP